MQSGRFKLFINASRFLDSKRSVVAAGFEPLSLNEKSLLISQEAFRKWPVVNVGFKLFMTNQQKSPSITRRAFNVKWSVVKAGFESLFLAKTKKAS